MEKKKLYMIGNSHIDPVWFWDWDEGMQEVKATFRSALDRMGEYPTMKFTSTSSAFFEWIEEVAPDMFEEIRQRVREGRWELAGGWFIEPDCILPCGEAFVRQGLYAQRYFREKFGKICRSGSNVDSFGHNPMLPQILKESGMEEYVFMRPRLDTPVFLWESADGSRVNAVSLPSEYTTWFYESTKEAAELALKAAKRAKLHGILCCYGVGNHGGGPTKANVEAVFCLREQLPDTELEFSSYGEFFDHLTEEEKTGLPVVQAFFDGVNTGCYSVDGRLKKSNRQAENRLFAADSAVCMEALFSGRAGVPKREADRLRDLWKTLLFNQFHDTLGGTAVKPARDEAVMQFGKVCADAKIIRTISVQRILRQIDTRGEGFPLVLFNPEGKDYDGPVTVELNWFCKDGLILKNPEGEEIGYQRIHTLAKVRNYNLGGRRGIVFDAHVPACGFAVYRTLTGEPAACCDAREDGGLLQEGCVLENEFLRASFGPEGCLTSLYDKTNGYEALAGPVYFPVWQDERDTWGGDQGRSFADTGERMKPVSLELVEDGTFRKVVRAAYRYQGSSLKQEYILYHNARHLEVVNHLYWDREWQMLKIAYPLCVKQNLVFQESACYTAARRITDGKEYSMHRFVDVTENGAEGFFTANDCKYAFTLEKETLTFPVARSAIYAQGNGKDWYHPLEGYSYTDIGKQEFTFYLMPHGDRMENAARYRLAGLAAGRLFYTTDNCHEGTAAVSSYRGICLREENVELCSMKPAEEGDALIVRLFETQGKKTDGVLIVGGYEMPYTIGKYQILTLKLYEDGRAERVNMLEDGWDSGSDHTLMSGRDRQRWMTKNTV